MFLFSLTDEIFFLSKEDNAVPTKAKIIMQEIEENRGI
jgi:hypothetical protein